MTNDAMSEFDYLPAMAAAIARTTPLPPAERVHLTLPDARELSALRFGDTNPGVTFLHGVGLNAHTWDTTVLALGLPTLTIDLPGHGDSSWRQDADYSPRTLAPDVITALETWTDTPQVLVGHSLGGLTATAIAAARPDLVRRLVIVDITPGVEPGAGPSELSAFFAGPSSWANRDELVDRAMSFGLGGDRDATMRGVTLNSRIRADGRVEWKHHFAQLANAAANAAAAGLPAPANGTPQRALLSPQAWADLDAVKAPVTLVRGDAGYVTDADAAAFSARRPDANIVTVASRHNVQEQAPVALAAIVREQYERTNDLAR